jgi:hypothetical protein
MARHLPHLVEHELAVNQMESFISGVPAPYSFLLAVSAVSRHPFSEYP